MAVTPVSADQLDLATHTWNDRQVRNIRSAKFGSAAVNGEPSSLRGLRWLAAFFGISVLAVGGVATFFSTNGAGSAALVVGGIALLVLGGLGDRVDLLKVGSVEFHLRAAARELSRRADELEVHGDDAAAEHLREEAERLLLQASPAARSYEELRRTRPAGPQRTAELYRLVNDAKRYAKNQHPSAEAVSDTFKRGGDGDRVYALVLMQEDPATGDVACVLDAISRSRSAFEQYQSLSTAIKMLARLGNSDRNQLSDAIREQMRPGGYITESTDRWRLAEQILNETDHEEPR